MKLENVYASHNGDIYLDYKDVSICIDNSKVLEKLDVVLYTSTMPVEADIIYLDNKPLIFHKRDGLFEIGVINDDDRFFITISLENEIENEYDLFRRENAPYGQEYD